MLGEPWDCRVWWVLGGLLAVSLGACGEDDAALVGSTDSATDGDLDPGGSTTSRPDPGTTSADSNSGSESTTSGEPGSTSGADPTSTGGSTTGEPSGPGPAAACYQGVFENIAPLPNYDQHDIEVGSHCLGSNHQTIDDIDRVVFLGDSVTVGTPPTGSEEYYRARLADMLADKFALDTGGNFGLWKIANPFDGTSSVKSSGDFWSCSKWGARNDDFGGEDSGQLAGCFPPELAEERTLVIMTMGGNDLSALAQDAADGVPIPELWDQAVEIVEYKRAAIEWLVDPERFPNGNHVVFANIYEFTDATGQVEGCDLSGLAGFDPAVPVPTDILIIVAWLEEQYAKIASETGTDFIFMFEEFCGHGFNADDPEAACYRGPGNETWFDLTCIHPNSTGHGVIADMFLAVIDE